MALVLLLEKLVDLFLLTSGIDYFLWVKITCTGDVGGVQDYEEQFQRKVFNRIYCIQLFRNVRPLRN